MGALLEILGDTILKLEDGGIRVTIKDYDRDGVKGIAVFLRDVQIEDGILVTPTTNSAVTPCDTMPVTPGNRQNNAI